MSIKYFPVIPNPNKAVFRRSLKYVNTPAYTSQDGIFHQAECRGIEPNSLGMYIVDTNEPRWGEMKLAALRSFVKDGDLPIIGEFDKIEDAIQAQMKHRVLTDAEKILRADQIIRENEEREHAVTTAKTERRN